MKLRSVTIGCLLAARGVLAGEIELQKGAVMVHPPDAEGAACIAGLPGCVTGWQPIRVSARNRATGAVAHGTVSGDGGFSLSIPASAGDAVKLTFISRGGDDKDMTVKVPGTRAARGRERTEVNVDLGAFSRFGAPEVVQVKPYGKGGTRVHVGRRPVTPSPAPAVTGSPAPAETASPAPAETPSLAPADLSRSPAGDPQADG